MTKFPIPQHPESRGRTRSRILLAAEESVERAELQKLLEGWGYEVNAAASGPALLAALSRGVSSILILDNELPQLDGLALLHQLQLQSHRRRGWTITLTGTPSPNATLLSRDARIDDCLAKPINEYELRVCLHAATRIQAFHIEMTEAIDAARFQAGHDSLTGLWNRESLLTMLFQETDRTQRLGSPLIFLLIDLDHFSQVNREHGYDGGDRVLQQLSSRFRQHLRSYDLAGRCGEDEFLIAMPGCTREDAGSMANRLRECIAERPFNILQASMKVTASVGIAQSGGRSPLVTLREAERALAGAKLAGRNCIRFFDPGKEDGAAREEASTQQASPMGDLRAAPV